MEADRAASPQKRRWLFCLLLCCAPLPLRWSQVRGFAALGLSDERYSYTLCVPLIVLFLLFFRRSSSCEKPLYCRALLLPVALLAGALGLAPTGWLSLPVLLAALAVYWIACFVLFYGARAAKQVVFPLGFLFLTIPLPPALMDRAVTELQRGSANTVSILFQAAGIPVYQQGVQLTLPGIDVQVAQECSGIRSSTALFLTAALAGQLLLRSGWSQTLFALLAIPIAIFKNALRIFAISWLGIYVDPGFLHGRLHRYGGLPFSAVAVAMLVPFLFALRRWEAGRLTRIHPGDRGGPVPAHFRSKSDLSAV